MQHYGQLKLDEILCKSLNEKSDKKSDFQGRSTHTDKIYDLEISSSPSKSEESSPTPEQIADLIAKEFRLKKDVAKGAFFQKHRALWDKARNRWEVDPTQNVWIKRDPKSYREEYESGGSTSSSSKDSK